MSIKSVAVVSTSFSKHAGLCSALANQVSRVWFNTEGRTYSEDALVDFIADADAAIIGREWVDAAVINRLSIRLLAKYGVGLDNIDQAALRQRGIALGWTPGVNAMAVAEQTVGFMIGLQRNLYYTARCMAQGDWIKNGGRQLSGCTVGIVGVGHIGQALVQLLAPFGCRILGCDSVDKTDYYAAHGIEAADFETVMRTADVVSLHVPLTVDTHHMINATTLAWMQPTAVLINTARGEVVDTAALYTALKDSRLGGAALDVFESEPYAGPLANHPRVIATPHIAGNANEAVLAMGYAAIDSILKYPEGGDGV
ncbi:phosphoglycerate dehydrogenase [Candidatus Marinamargulisbacteria bacterium]|nr:phosphoglycerate dehydrogenase [Candidatus Marinamargulisbacteria bacterium]